MIVKVPSWPLQIVVAFLSAAMSSAQAGDPAIERIRSEWKERQDRVRSFIVEWEEQRTVPARMGGVGKGGYVPLQDTVYSIRHRMVGSGNRLRLDRNGLQYDSTANDFIEKKFVRVFDGRERRELFQQVTNPDNPGGFLN